MVGATTLKGANMRRFECVEGTSSKFWEVEVVGSAVHLRWGRIGSAGQRQEKAFADSAAADTFAEKQIGGKREKGYTEVGGTAKAAPVIIATTGHRASSPIPPPKIPTSLAGPQMHRLTDAPLTPKQALKFALKPLKAIDPVWDVDVPRAAAHMFLHALNMGRPNLWFDPKSAQREPEIMAAGVFPESAMEGLFAQYGSTLRDTYRFPFESAVFLLEALYGTERVAGALVARLAAIAADPKMRKNDGAGVQYDNTHFGLYRMAWSLAALCPRLPDQWGRVTAPLANVKGKKDFDKTLRVLAGEGAPVDLAGPTPVELGLGLSDYQALEKYYSRWPYYYWTPRFYYVLGHEAWDKSKMDELPRLPKWLQQRMVRWFGTIRHAATARAMLWLMRGRSVREEAMAWLVAHRELACPDSAQRRPPEVGRAGRRSPGCAGPGARVGRTAQGSSQADLEDGREGSRRPHGWPGRQAGRGWR
jgi:predicted DNA-binding WGR domain protein